MFRALCYLRLSLSLFQCGGVTKEHYRQMVQLDEGNIELTWECPPCHAKSHPEPDPEPPQQTVAKLPPRPRATPSEPVIRPAPVTPVMTMPRPILPSNGVKRAMPQTNGVGVGGGGGGINNGMNFPDVRVRDLPFYPVKATLLRPCTLVAKKNSTVKVHKSFVITVNKTRRIISRTHKTRTLHST